MLSAIFGSQGTPQLIKATLQNNLEFLKKNSKHLAEVRDLDGRSLLHIASSEGHVEIVKYLLTLRLDPNLVDKDGSSSHMVSHFTHTLVIIARWSSLHCACNRGHIGICELLISAGADVKLANNQGTTVLHYALGYERSASESRHRALLRVSVDVHTSYESLTDVNSENQFGETPLHQACFKGSELSVMWLIKNKADVDHRTKKKVTPLHMAAMMGHRSVAEILLYANADLTLVSDNGTPIELARTGKHHALASYLESILADRSNLRSEPYRDNDHVLNCFLQCKKEGLNHFPEDCTFVTIKVGTVLKAVAVDFHAPVKEWMEVLAKKLLINDIEDYTLILNPPNMHSFALDPNRTVPEQLHLASPAEVSPAIIFDFKRRARLLDPKLAIVKQICAHPDLEEMDSLAKALVLIFYNCGKAMVLLNWALHTEVNEKAKWLLFREDSIYTKIVTNYLRLIGSTYMAHTIGPIIASIAQQKTSYEMDPNRPDGKKSNYKKLKQLVEKFIAALLRSLEYCPVQIRALCMEIKTIVESRFPDVVYAALSGFIFLRFLCPAITTPVNYKIIEEPPVPEAARGLILAAKILQNIANAVDFGEKEPFLVPFNKYMAKRRDQLKKYLDTLVSPPPPGVSPVLVKISDEQECEAAARIEKHLRVVNHVMTGLGSTAL